MITRWVRLFWPTLAVALLVVGVAGISLLGRSGLHDYHATPPRPIRQSSTGDPPPPGGHTLQVGWFVEATLILFLVLASALVVVTAVVLTKRLIGARRRRVAAEVATMVDADDAEVLAAVESGLAELADDGVDPRAAVIACWVRLEAIAMAAGIERRPGDTPSDLVTRLLDRYRVSEDALTSLTELYHVARYSTRVIASTMRDDARAALGRLRTDLAATGAPR